MIIFSVKILLHFSHLCLDLVVLTEKSLFSITFYLLLRVEGYQTFSVLHYTHFEK